MLVRRTWPVAAAFLALSLAACNPSVVDDKPAAAGSPAPGAQGGGDDLTLPAAVKLLPVGVEKRDGYERDSFKHWVDEDSDSCNTRQEVLIAEAVKPPEQGARCALTGGEWLSYYDEETVTAAGKLDIDHMVPLAEAWDSGASEWDADRRERYANDLEAERSLVAVTARTNRQKSDKDPSNWLPPSASAQCTYGADWVGTKLRWKLQADEKEIAALEKLAAECTDTAVVYEVAP
ncbi:HNH endonuclease family protein [Streptomyces sp. ME02-6979-3A]|uniref:HNH endonuclease family protein n=1 Tax=Streptomyces sp. ME02-6979-3A TaxID=3028673 RepID=UPI0029A48314|nr:HNH endonuclease family protein [Streptomyces sp. ME02-6979-3A]MDX3324734.1 HNH endonuclease family protein [Streptomyces sp. ME02-6979-3A]